MVYPLTRMDRKDVDWEFEIEQKEVWKNIKKRIQNSFKLSYPTPTGMFMSVSDCCGIGMSWALLQKQWCEVLGKYLWHIIRFKSKLLPKNMVESAKHISVKEMYTSIKGIQHNKYYLMPKTFILVIDHKNLKHLFDGTALTLEENEIMLSYVYRLRLLDS